MATSDFTPRCICWFAFIAFARYVVYERLVGCIDLSEVQTNLVPCSRINFRVSRARIISAEKAFHGEAAQLHEHHREGSEAL